MVKHRADRSNGDVVLGVILDERSHCGGHVRYVLAASDVPRVVPTMVIFSVSPILLLTVKAIDEPSVNNAGICFKITWFGSFIARIRITVFITRFI